MRCRYLEVDAPFARNLAVPNERKGSKRSEIREAAGYFNSAIWRPTSARVHTRRALSQTLFAVCVFEQERGKERRAEGEKRENARRAMGGTVLLATVHSAVDIVLRRLLLRFHLTPRPVGGSRLSGKYLSVIRAGRMELKTVALRDAEQRRSAWLKNVSVACELCRYDKSRV